MKKKYLVSLLAKEEDAVLNLKDTNGKRRNILVTLNGDSVKCAKKNHVKLVEGIDDIIVYSYTDRKYRKVQAKAVRNVVPLRKILYNEEESHGESIS